MVRFALKINVSRTNNDGLYVKISTEWNNRDFTSTVSKCKMVLLTAGAEINASKRVLVIPRKRDRVDQTID
jgi:hypothetical protein